MQGKCKPHLLSHAHFLNTSLARLFVQFFVCVVSSCSYTGHALTHALCMAQGLRSVCFSLCFAYLQLMMYHSPCLLFPHGHFEHNFPTPMTPPTATSLRPSTSSLTELYPSRNRGARVLQTSGEEFVFLADSTGYEPKRQLHKPFSEEGDATPVNDPNHDNLSDFSRLTREHTELSVNVCVDPSVSHSVLPEKRQLRETRCRQREKMEKKVQVL